MKIFIRRAGCFLAAFLSTCSISELMNLRSGVPFSHSVLTLLLWGGLCAFYLHISERWKREEDVANRKRRFCYAGFLCVLFGVLTVAGYQLQWLGYTGAGVTGKLKILVYGVGVGMILFPFAEKLFALMDVNGSKDLSNKSVSKATNGSAKVSVPWKSAKVFFAGWFGVWLCWIPVWLAYYPVIMSYDFHKQSLEALWGPEYFDTHHPLIHTWLIYLFRNLGEQLGSYEAGYAWFSLLQQMIVSAVLGYACVMVYRLTRKKWATVLTGLFFGCFPLISVLVMCTTKDVLFGGFFMLFILLFVERSFFGEGRRNIMDALWVMSGILMMLFRNNALYAMLVFGIFFVVLSKKNAHVRAVILVVLLLAGGKGALAGLQYGFDASEGDEIEKYSVIYQSMARVGQRQNAILTPEDYELIDTYVTSKCWEDYNPPIADTIKMAVQKANFNEKDSWSDMGQVLKAWVTIGLRYPNDYIDAFLDLTRGYWFMDDTSHAEMLGVGLEERMGLLYTYNSAAPESLPGMQHISKFPWLEEQLEKILSDNAYYDWPVISNLFKPALWCWLLVICVLLCLYQKDRQKLLICLYPLCYFATMLLGPTAIVRYVFQFILVMPVLLALIPGRGKEKSISIHAESMVK